MSNSFDFISLYQNEYSPEEKINENFQKIEYFTNLSVVAKISTSNNDTVQSDCNYLIDQNNDEYFSDKINQIATYNNNLGWIFFQPKEGQIMYLQSDGKHYKYTGNNWVVFATGGSSSGTIDDIDTYTKDEIDTKLANISTTGNVDTSNLLTKTNNLSDLTNKTTARTNLGVYSTSEVENTFVKKSANLSDLTNMQNARNNLDVYQKCETYNRSKNLLDILDQDIACHNIGTLRDWEIRRLGDYKVSAQKTDHDNWLICNGRAISRTTYKDLFALIGTSFGAGDESTTFNLPNFQGKTIWGANGNLNATLAAGLPNLTGTIGAVSTHRVSFSTGDYTGVFASSSKLDTYAGSDSGSTRVKIDFNASKSNAIYGKSLTVQPPAICVNIFILAKA